MCGGMISGFPSPPPRVFELRLPFQCEFTILFTENQLLASEGGAKIYAYHTISCAPTTYVYDHPIFSAIEPCLEDFTLLAYFDEKY